MTPWRCWGTPTDASAVMAVHRRLSYATRSNDDIDWHVKRRKLSRFGYVCRHDTLDAAENILHGTVDGSCHRRPSKS